MAFGIGQLAPGNGYPALGNRAGVRIRSRPRGFTIVEMLISLAITALLMAAVAGAVQAVLMSYTENMSIAEVAQASRVVLYRMMSEARTADAISIGSHRLTIIPPANEQGIDQIEYELSGGVLSYRTTVDGNTTSQAVVSAGQSVEIVAFTVTRQTAVDGEGVTYTVSVTAQLTLQCGKETMPITASACPRRNLTF